MARRAWTVARSGCGIVGVAALVYLWRVSWHGSDPRHLVLVWLACAAVLTIAHLSGPRPQGPTRATLWAAIIVAFALVPRLVWLRDAPYAVAADEIIPAHFGMDALQAESLWRLLASVSYYSFDPSLGAPYPTQVLQAWPSLFIDPLYGARLASVLLSIVSLFATFALARSMFGERTALLSLFFLSMSHWHIVYSRLAYTVMQPMAALPLSMYLLWRGVKTGGRLYQYLTGIALGFCMLIYSPSRIAIPLAVLWLGYLTASRRTRGRAAAAVLIAAALGVLVVVTPQVRARGAESLFLRFNQSALDAQRPLGMLLEAGPFDPAAWRMLAAQFERSLAVYLGPGAQLGPHDPIASGLVDPLTFALAMIGLLVAVARLGDDRYFLLLAWVMATFFAGQVLTDVPSAAYRASPLLPALAILAAATAEQIGAWLRARWVRRTSTVAIATGAAIAAVFVVAWNLAALRQFFEDRSWNPTTAVARMIAAGPPDAVYYLVGPDRWERMYTVRFLGRGRAMASTPNLMDSLGRDIVPQRPAVFVLAPELHGAAYAVQRCYPGTALLHEGPNRPGGMVLGVLVDPPAIHGGKNCAAPLDGPGLLADYPADTDGPPPHRRVEDWPTRFRIGAKPIRWTGTVRAPFQGTYRFKFDAFDAVGDARIASVALPRSEPVEISLEPGEHPVAVTCRSASGEGFCLFRWAPPGGNFEFIPAQFLRPPRAGD